MQLHRQAGRHGQAQQGGHLVKAAAAAWQRAQPAEESSRQARRQAMFQGSSAAAPELYMKSKEQPQLQSGCQSWHRSTGSPLAEAAELALGTHDKIICCAHACSTQDAHTWLGVPPTRSAHEHTLRTGREGCHPHPRPHTGRCKRCQQCAVQCSADALSLPCRPCPMPTHLRGRTGSRTGSQGRMGRWTPTPRPCSSQAGKAAVTDR